MISNRSEVQGSRVYRKSEPLICEFCLPARQACEAGGNEIGMRIERGEHMSYPPKFEDIEACLRATHMQAVSPRGSLQEQS